MLAYSGKTKKYYSVAPSDGYETEDKEGTGLDTQQEVRKGFKLSSVVLAFHSMLHWYNVLPIP